MTASQGRRFLHQDGETILNPDFHLSGIDLTGVGFRPAGEQRAVTLVSPKHFLYARHYRLSAGTALHFVKPDGGVVVGTILKNHDILNSQGKATDLCLGELENVIHESSGIISQPYLNHADPLNDLPFFLDPPHENLIVLGRNWEGGIGTLAGFERYFGGGGLNAFQTIFFDYYVSAGEAGEVFFEAGDSGGVTLTEVNGRGAIISIHSHLQTFQNPLREVTRYRNFGGFVGTPLYISQMNEVMSESGFHMKKSYPDEPEVTFEVLTHEAPIRAGYDGVLQYEIENLDLQMNAKNLKLQHGLAEGIVASVSGNGWVDLLHEELCDVRLAELPAESATMLTESIRFDHPGQIQLVVSLDFDGSAVLHSQTVELTILESYKSFCQNMTNPSFDGDEDGDGIVNLMEYAFGGNVEEASIFQETSGRRMMPQVLPMEDEGLIRCVFLRRIDALERALSYRLEASTDLIGNEWGIVTPLSEERVDLENGFEEISVLLESSEQGCFYRVKVDLAE